MSALRLIIVDHPVSVDHNWVRSQAPDVKPCWLPWRVCRLADSRYLFVRTFNNSVGIVNSAN